MRASATLGVFVTMIVAATFTVVTPGFAFKWVCPQAGITQCQNMNVAGTCSQWTCVASASTAPPSTPAARSNVSNNWQCVQSNLPNGSLCHSASACIISGTCQAGGCAAQTILSCPPSTTLGVQCSCLLSAPGGKATCGDMFNQNDNKYCPAGKVTRIGPTH